MPMTNAYPTKQQVLELTRSLLGDVRQSGGKLYSDSILDLPVQTAVRSAYRVLRNLGDFRIIRVGYLKLPAKQTVLIPQSAGLPDFFAPIELWGRKGVAFYKVTNAEKNGRNLDLTVTPSHSIATGEYALVTATDIAGFPSVFGEYQGYAVNSTIIRLLGCDAAGAWVEDASRLNQVGIGTERFGEILWARDIGNVPVDDWNINSVANTDFTGGRFNFRSFGEDMQIRIRYYSTMETPVDGTDVIEIPDSLDFLALSTAATATITRMPTLSQSFRQKLWGAGREGFPDDGEARAMALSVAKSQANLRYSDKSRPGYTNFMNPWVRS